MPLYEYNCRKCGHSFETLVTVRATAAPATACPECESADVERLISLPAQGKVSAPNTCGEGPPCGAPRCGRKR